MNIEANAKTIAKLEGQVASRRDSLDPETRIRIIRSLDAEHHSCFDILEDNLVVFGTEFVCRKIVRDDKGRVVPLATSRDEFAFTTITVPLLEEADRA